MHGARANGSDILSFVCRLPELALEGHPSLTSQWKNSKSQSSPFRIYVEGFCNMKMCFVPGWMGFPHHANMWLMDGCILRLPLIQHTLSCNRYTILWTHESTRQHIYPTWQRHGPIVVLTDRICVPQAGLVRPWMDLCYRTLRKALLRLIALYELVLFLKEKAWLSSIYCW